jgi:hypothetical protein
MTARPRASARTKSGLVTLEAIKLGIKCVIGAKGSMELLFSLDRVAANVQAACPLED